MSDVADHSTVVFNRSGLGLSTTGRTSHDSAPTIIVYLILLNLIPPVLVVPGLGAAGRPAALLGLGLLLLWVLALFRPRIQAEAPVAIRWAFFVWLLVYIAAMIAGLDRGLPVAEASQMDREFLGLLSAVGIAFVLIDGLPTYRSIERVLMWLVGLGAAGAAAGILQFVFGFDVASRIRVPGLVLNAETVGIGTRGDQGFSRVRGLASHPIEYGVVLATLLPIGLYLWTVTASRWIRVFTILIAAAIPLSISRAAVVSLVVAVGVYAVGWTWRQRVNAAATGFVALVGYQAVAPGLLGTIRSLFTNASTDDSVTGRTEDFGATAGFISDRPWLGRGPGTFLVDTYRLLDNEYLGTLIESGWLGLAAFAFVLISALLTSTFIVRRTHCVEHRSAARALGAAVATAAVVSAFFDSMSFPTFAGVLVCCIGCLGALYRIEVESDLKLPPESSGTTG